jgi:hypothetical protein
MRRPSTKSAAFHFARACDRPKNPLRQNGDLASYFNVIWVVQSRCQKYSAFHLTQISGYLLAVLTRQEGRIAIVTNAGWDAVDAAASGAQRGRRVS